MVENKRISRIVEVNNEYGGTILVGVGNGEMMTAILNKRSVPLAQPNNLRKPEIHEEINNVPLLPSRDTPPTAGDT